MNAIANHRHRTGTSIDAQIYPGGGRIGDMRVIVIRSKKEDTLNKALD